MPNARPMILSLFSAAALGAGALAGSLTPPAGAPTSTYRTLQEVEPRTPLTQSVAPGDADSLYKITQPGNYYLTGDLVGVAGKAGIEITTSDVSIDLNGFTMRGVAGAKWAIGDHGDEQLPSPNNITIRNGTIAFWPQNGVSGDWFGGVRIERIAFRANGYSGVSVNSTATVIDSAFYGHTGTGVSIDGAGLVSHCVSVGNAVGFYGNGVHFESCSSSYDQTGFSGSSSHFIDCTAANSSSFGFELNARSLARGCKASNTPTGAKLVGPYSAVEDCSFLGIGVNGVLVGAVHCTVKNNTFHGVGTSNTDAAIQVNVGVTNVLIAGNSGTAVKRGVDVDGTNCLIVGNSFGGLLTGGSYTYSFAAGNRYGPIVGAATGPSIVVSPNQSIAGSFSTTDPNANISY